MKNLRTFVVYLFAFFALSSLVTSCQQDNVMEEMEAVATNQNAPIANYGVFKFRDIKHFESYYNQMNKLYDDNAVQFEQLKLANIGVETVQYKFDNQKFRTFEEMYKPFLADPIMMNIVNEHLEFQIGEILLTIVTNELILISEVKDSRIQSEIRQLEKGSAFNHLEIPRGTYLVTDRKMEDILGPWGETEYNFSIEDYNADTRMSCAEQEVSSVWDWKEINGQAISFRTSAYYSGPITVEEAHCFSYAKFESTGWPFPAGTYWFKSNTARLSSHIFANRRNNEDCSFNGLPDDKKDVCKNCSESRARLVSWGKYAHRTGDVTSNFLKAWETANGSSNSMTAGHTLKFD